MPWQHHNLRAKGINKNFLQFVTVCKIEGRITKMFQILLMQGEDRDWGWIAPEADDNTLIEFDIVDGS